MGKTMASQEQSWTCWVRIWNPWTSCSTWLNPSWSTSGRRPPESTRPRASCCTTTTCSTSEMATSSTTTTRDAILIQSRSSINTSGKRLSARVDSEECTEEDIKRVERLSHSNTKISDRWVWYFPLSNFYSEIGRLNAGHWPRVKHLKDVES